MLVKCFLEIRVYAQLEHYNIEWKELTDFVGFCWGKNNIEMSFKNQKSVIWLLFSVTVADILAEVCSLNMPVLSQTPWVVDGTEHSILTL